MDAKKTSVTESQEAAFDAALGNGAKMEAFMEALEAEDAAPLTEAEVVVKNANAPAIEG